MKSIALIVMSAIVSIALGVYVPIKLAELSMEGLSLWLTVPLGLAALAAGGFIGFLGVAVPIIEIIEGREYVFREGVVDERWINAYRARQRAMLEELDEIRDLLVEIRDILRKGMGSDYE